MHALPLQPSQRCTPLLVLFVLLVHLPVLSTIWPTWDSWIYQVNANQANSEVVWTWLQAEARYVEGLLFAFNLELFSSLYAVAYKVQLALALVLTALLICRFITQNFGASPKIAAFSTAVAFVQPHFATLMSHNLAGQYLINCCLWIGLYLHSSGSRGIRRTIGILFVCISFDVNANLSLLLGLIAIETLAQMHRLNPSIPGKNRIFYRNYFQRKWITHYGPITLCPFIYFYARAFLWGPHGFASGYNKIIFFDTPRESLKSCVQSVFDIVSQGWGIHGAGFTSLAILIPFCIIGWSSRHQPQPRNINNSKSCPNQWVLLLQLLIAWIAVVIPYSAVGKSSYTGSAFQWEARHGLLYAFAIAASTAFLLTTMSRCVPFRDRSKLLAMTITLGSPAFIALESLYFNFHYTEFAERALIQKLQETLPPPENQTLIVDTSQFLPHRPEYRFFELRGIFLQAFGKDTPLMICPPTPNCHQFLRTVIKDQEHRKAFGLIDGNADSQADFLDRPPIHWKVTLNTNTTRSSHAFLRYLALLSHENTNSYLKSQIAIHRTDHLPKSESKSMK